jgi:DUF4097 and DUF4098 domain-containing protein YvlB
MRKLSLLPIALIVLAGQAAAQKEIPPAAPFKRTVWVAPQGFVRLFQLTGSLRVLGWDRDSLAISGTMHVPEQGEFTVTPGKQGVRVSLWGPDELRAKPSDLTIYVPRASQLWIKTQSAAVTVQDFEGRLDIETVSGNVAVNGRPRELYLETMGGSAQLALESRSARVKTGTGSITFKGTLEEALLSTVSGALSALDAQVKQGRFESLEGRISFTGELLQPAALEFVNHAGDIELTLSPRSLAQVTVSTVTGRFQDDFGVQGKGLPGKGVGKGEFTFWLGRDPLADINVRTFKGAVILRKRGN